MARTNGSSVAQASAGALAGCELPVAASDQASRSAGRVAVWVVTTSDHGGSASALGRAQEAIQTHATTPATSHVERMFRPIPHSKDIACTSAAIIAVDSRDTATR
jgi:thiamine monophosphate kinase